MPEPNQGKAPKLGEPVHYAIRGLEPAARYGPCRSARVIQIPKTEEGDYLPRYQVMLAVDNVNVELKDIATALAGKITNYLCEYSPDGHAGTYHYPEDCDD